MYDQQFAQERRRARLAGGRGRCAICADEDLTTGSDYEWPCLILQRWICETHCAEVQLQRHDATRAKASALIGWSRPPIGLLEICGRCPYSDRGVPPLKPK